MKKFELNAFLVIALVVLFSLTAYAAQFILGQSGATTTSTSPVFSRSLSEGASGSDVWVLNQILDIEFNTTIASPEIFGATTQTNLIKLQERYASEILTPSGLTVGNGIVGPATITELNTLAQEYHLSLANAPAPAPAPYVTPVKQVFITTLSLGTVSNDVTLLKTILNSDPTTALTYTSAAEELDPVNLFDAATQAAVIRFQEKYASEILTPSGLTVGNGIVGPATRNKLNEILAGFSSSTGAQNSSANASGAGPTSLTQNNTTVTSNSCTTDLFSCGDWGACVNGTQTRTCNIIYACQAPNANHTLGEPTSQSCTATPLTALQACLATQQEEYASTQTGDQSQVATAQTQLTAAQMQLKTAQTQLNAAETRVATSTGNTQNNLNPNKENQSSNSAVQAAQNAVQQAQYAVSQAQEKLQQAQSQLSSAASKNQAAITACNPNAIPAGTVVANGYIDTCLSVGKQNCVITSGNASCNSNAISCPSGSSLSSPGTATQQPSASWCPPLFNGPPNAILRNNFSCIEKGAPAAASTNTGCNGDILCGIGNAVGGLVGGILSIF